MRIAQKRASTFLSTPSARRATSRIEIMQAVAKFLSTPSARRATSAASTNSAQVCTFLSTPSARRATGLQGFAGAGCKISIHALREEGDL